MSRTRGPLANPLKSRQLILVWQAMSGENQSTLCQLTLWPLFHNNIQFNTK